MSGAVAAHAAYNGAGTQGLAVTNKINDTGDVMSVFWTKHDTTRQLLHGSSIVEVVSAGSAGATNSFGSSRIFTVNNDVDVLGDLFLELTLNVKFDSATGSTNERNLLDYEFDKNFQYKLIDRVEFMVGTQIWHTVTGHDIKVLTKTSKAESCTDVLSKQMSSEKFLPGHTDDTTSAEAPLPADSGSSTPLTTDATEEVKTIIWIPALSADLSAPLRKFYDVTENGYLMAAAPQQAVKIKVTFASGSAISKFLEVKPDSSVTTPATDSLNAYPTIEANTLGTGKIGTKGSVFDLPITNTDISAAAAGDYYPFRRVVLVHKNAETVIGTGITAGTHTITTTIGRVRLFAKQIMLCKEERDQIRGIPTGLPYRIKMSQSIKSDLPTGIEKTLDLDSFSLYASHLIIGGDWSDANITHAELKLNSSSFSGNIPALILRNDMAESLRLYSGRSLTNPHILTGKYVENLGRFEREPLIFPLASTAFSGSCVPFNRFDSIRLTLRFSKIPASKTLDLTDMAITVTCVGETTILYKGGAATLAMY